MPSPFFFQWWQQAVKMGQAAAACEEKQMWSLIFWGKCCNPAGGATAHETSCSRGRAVDLLCVRERYWGRAFISLWASVRVRVRVRPVSGLSASTAACPTGAGIAGMSPRLQNTPVGSNRPWRLFQLCPHETEQEDTIQEQTNQQLTAPEVLTVRAKVLPKFEK